MNKKVEKKRMLSSVRLCAYFNYRGLKSIDCGFKKSPMFLCRICLSNVNKAKQNDPFHPNKH